MKTWQTTADVWVDGLLYAEGSEIVLTSSQSKYLGHALKEPEDAAAKTQVRSEIVDAISFRSRKPPVKDTVNGSVD